MSLILGVDGFDGAGKTTLCAQIMSSLKERGSSVRLVGRDSSSSNPWVAGMTDLVKESDAGGSRLSPASDMHLRLARLAERLSIAERAAETISVWDRLILSDASMLPLGLRSEFLECAIRMLKPFEVHHVQIEVPREVLMERILTRPDKSPKELLGRAHLAALHAQYQEASQGSAFPWRSITLDGTQGLNENIEKVLCFIE